MRVLQINTVFGRGSTGNIVAEIQKVCEENSIDTLAAYRYHDKNTARADKTLAVSTWFDYHVHNRLFLITMLQGCFSRFRTYLFLKKVDNFSPNIIHLHNIHGSYINHGMLFQYIKKRNIPVIWTLHDCWSFTGYCPYFTLKKCDRWKTGCGHCPNKKLYSETIFDNSRLMYKGHL